MIYPFGIFEFLFSEFMLPSHLDAGGFSFGHILINFKSSNWESTLVQQISPRNPVIICIHDSWQNQVNQHCHRESADMVEFRHITLRTVKDTRLVYTPKFMRVTGPLICTHISSRPTRAPLHMCCPLRSISAQTNIVQSGSEWGQQIVIGA